MAKTTLLSMLYRWKHYVLIPNRGDDNKTFIKTEFLRDTVESVDCGDEAARWLSQKIKQTNFGYRLGYYHADEPKWETRNPNKPIDDFNKQTPVEDLPAVIFRPNIVVDGSKPYDEDNWKSLKIGEDVILKNIKNCTRCVFSTTDPEGEPSRTLSRYRMNKGPEKGPLTGIHLKVNKSGLIKIGDPIFIAYF
ncbi:hypothetical protein HHI36_018394 [Cryptolaemus montrouzieri]|uniref:MOSC domain-containing protein n=1 Tax=Cryptolaemus montrouzieri TaxID=559131 RepID=A0ABD2P0S3_9CUCU